MHDVCHTMEYDQLVSLKKNHPAWRLLSADNGPMIASFLHRSFIIPNIRTFARQQLASQLDDHLYHLHARARDILFPNRLPLIWTTGQRMNVAGCANITLLARTSRITTWPHRPKRR
jgi:hypothetical protein